ncbi:MAG: hypothetical protein LBR09_02710 [Endomicrobium sp.]|jgi:hypothetical protein|nr:hypothetical protein [Endomicrobium sp.]
MVLKKIAIILVLFQLVGCTPPPAIIKNTNEKEINALKETYETEINALSATVHELWLCLWMGLAGVMVDGLILLGAGVYVYRRLEHKHLS